MINVSSSLPTIGANRGSPLAGPERLAAGRGERIAAVIPCYRAASTVQAVIAGIPPEVTRIFIVDDGCPEATGTRVLRERTDARVVVLHNGENRGVGGAVKRGYSEALKEDFDVVVKIDADGQMDPSLIPVLVRPVLSGEAENRFALPHRMPPSSYRGQDRPMPPLRRLGNNLLSFLHKGVTGYWNIYDPTNGYTAISRQALESIELAAVADCYFFETDVLFHLNLADAVVQDVPMPVRYSGEVSSLKISGVLARFPRLVVNRFARRIGVKYFLQDFNVASLELLCGLVLLVAGAGFGVLQWAHALSSGVPASAGTVMFAALPIIIGVQLLLAAVSYDVLHTPRVPISTRIGRP